MLGVGFGGKNGLADVAMSEFYNMCPQSGISSSFRFWLHRFHISCSYKCKIRTLRFFLYDLFQFSMLIIFKRILKIYLFLSCVLCVLPVCMGTTCMLSAQRNHKSV